MRAFKVLDAPKHRKVSDFNDKDVEGKLPTGNGHTTALLAYVSCAPLSSRAYGTSLSFAENLGRLTGARHSGAQRAAFKIMLCAA